MSDLEKSICDRLQVLMWRRGWSAAELERRAGLGHGYLSQILLGKRQPSLRTISRLEGALGSPIIAIAGRKPERTDSGRSYRRRAVPRPLTYAEMEAARINRLLDEVEMSDTPW